MKPSGQYRKKRFDYMHQGNSVAKKFSNTEFEKKEYTHNFNK